ncbi:MAG TPA: hypothetical protein VLE72_00745 [Candidatus Saccharimonadales bacterium]|nr:hypothetical protein [Candidatus Saccharimonadales bacterium]
MAETEAQVQEERAASARKVRRIEIVNQTLADIARSLNEVCEPLSADIGLPKYFTLGDFLIVVHLFEKIDDDLTTDEPRLVIIQHCVSLVAIDRRLGSIETVRVGMLAWLRYESIYKTVTNARTYMDFDLERVLAKLSEGQHINWSPSSGDGLIMPGEGDLPDDYLG